MFGLAEQHTTLSRSIVRFCVFFFFSLKSHFHGCAFASCQKPGCQRRLGGQEVKSSSGHEGRALRSPPDAEEPQHSPSPPVKFLSTNYPYCAVFFVHHLELCFLSRLCHQPVVSPTFQSAFSTHHEPACVSCPLPMLAEPMQRFFFFFFFLFLFG